MTKMCGWLPVVFLVLVSCVNAQASHCRNSENDPSSRCVQLGDVVSVPINGTCPVISEVQKYRLLVDGSYTGIEAQGCMNVRTKETPVAQIRFLLSKDSDPPAANTAAAWRTLIGDPWYGGGSSRERQITFGVSDENGRDISWGTTSIFVWSPLWKMWTGGLVFLLAIFIFVMLAKTTALLRDVGSVTYLPLEERTFSLARTQMAWWTLIIVGSYIYEWIASGTMPPLSAQALALMGIYSVLTAGSRSVDLARGTHFPASVPLFFRDLVSDESGVAIHRVQMLIFTVIIGLMFIYQVLTTASMPALEPYTLAMIGISGATYIGLKATEPQPKLTDGAAKPGASADPTAPVDAGRPGVAGEPASSGDQPGPAAPANANDIKSAYSAGEAGVSPDTQQTDVDIKSAYSAGDAPAV